MRRDFFALGLSSVVPLALPSGMHQASAAVLEPRGAAAAIPRMHARMSDDVCQSYMVNTKTFYKDTVYGHTAAVVDLLEDLGVRIVRERVTTGTSIGTKKQQRAMLALADKGIRWHATVGEVENWRRADAVNRNVMRHLASEYGPHLGGDLREMMHSFGGCNEVDGPVYNGHRSRHWAQHARIMQRALWTAAKDHPATRHIPVAGPSTRTDITRRRARKLGDLSQFSDLANAHIYNKGTSPTRGIDEKMRILRHCFPDARHWIFSETGYNDSPQSNLGQTIPGEAAAIYAVRGICDFFRRRAVYGRFELLDDPDTINRSSQRSINRTADRQAHFGLVHMPKDTIRASTPDTWQKKPEFHATRRLLHLMADRGRNFSADPLRLRLSGGRNDLQHTLVQKRDGRHYLLLWRDVEVSTMYPNPRPIRVEPYPVTLHLGTERPTAVYEPRRDDRPVARHPARSRVTVPVGKDLVAVEIG